MNKRIINTYFQKESDNTDELLSEFRGILEELCMLDSHINNIMERVKSFDPTELKLICQDFNFNAEKIKNNTQQDIFNYLKEDYIVCDLLDIIHDSKLNSYVESRLMHYINGIVD